MELKIANSFLCFEQLKFFVPLTCLFTLWLRKMSNKKTPLYSTLEISIEQLMQY